MNTPRMARTWLSRLSRANPWTGALLLMLVAVHLGIVASILLEERSVIWPLHNDTIHRAGRGADFYAIYHAAQNLRKGTSPYASVPDGFTPYGYPFRYLPVAALAARPLSRLAPQTAYVAWVLLLEALLLVLLVALWRSIPDSRVRLATIGLLLVSSPYFLELYVGQCTFMAVTLCCLAVLLPMGLPLLCCSVLLKPLCLVVFPALMRERRYCAYWVITILCVLLFSAPYFVWHPDDFVYFISRNLALKGGLDAGNYGFIRLLSLLAQDLNMTFLLQNWQVWTSGIRLVVLGLTALLVFHARRGATVAAVSVLLLAHFLTYQHVWEHHMSAVCVIGAVLLTARDRERWFTMSVLLSLALLAIPTPFALLDVEKDPRVWDPSAHWSPYARYMLVLPKVVPTMALFIVSVLHLSRRGMMPPHAAMLRALTKAPSQRPAHVAADAKR